MQVGEMCVWENKRKPGEFRFSTTITSNPLVA